PRHSEMRGSGFSLPRYSIFERIRPMQSLPLEDDPAPDDLSRTTARHRERRSSVRAAPSRRAAGLRAAQAGANHLEGTIRNKADAEARLHHPADGVEAGDAKRKCRVVDFLSTRLVQI